MALAVSRTPLHPQWFSFLAKRRAIDAVAGAARGCILDIGCADGALRGRVSKGSHYLGLDYPATGKALYGARPEVFADAAALPFGDAMFDSVALLDVLEHLSEPRKSLGEIARVLRPGASLFLAVPCFYPLHDEPHDYQRPTEHGLRHWLLRAGFRVRSVEHRGAPAETIALLTNVALARVVHRIVGGFPPALVVIPVLAPVVLAVNVMGWFLGLLGRKNGFMPFAYWAVAERSDGVSVET